MLIVIDITVVHYVHKIVFVGQRRQWTTDAGALVYSVRLQLMIDQIVFGFQFFAARMACVPHRFVDGNVHVSYVLTQIACIRIDFATMLALWSSRGIVRIRCHREIGDCR